MYEQKWFYLPLINMESIENAGIRINKKMKILIFFKEDQRSNNKKSGLEYFLSKLICFLD